MYCVVISDVHGHTKRGKHFNTRNEAIKFISNLPDDYYMISLRNDSFKITTALEHE